MWKIFQWQGSFWGAILRDSRIFFSKIALILLRCENSRNIDVEATGIELGSMRVDLVLFQWNLRHDSVWVNDTFAFLVHFSELTRDRLRASSYLCLRRKDFKEFRRWSTHGWILPIKQRYFCNSYGYSHGGRMAVTSQAVRDSFYWNDEGRKLLTPFLRYIDVHKVCGKLGQGKIALGGWYTLIFSMNMD